MPSTALPPPSALSQFISSHSTSSSGDSSASTSTSISTPAQSSPPDALPLEILHNLRYQHSWSDLLLHPKNLVPSNRVFSPPVTLLSGLPPRSLYISPARQSHLLTHNIPEKTVQSEREWVLPLSIGGEEKWTLRHFAAVFDALPAREPWSTSGGGDGGNSDEAGGGKRDGEGGKARDEEKKKKNRKESVGGDGGKGDGVEDHRDAKRILLAMQADRKRGGDGTIVFYLMMEGDVKPRQN